MNINTEALTLALSYRLAIVDGRNTQAAIIQTARKLRGSTKCERAYNLLGEVITASPSDRITIASTTEKMFLADMDMEQ